MRELARAVLALAAALDRQTVVFEQMARVAADGVASDRERLGYEMAVSYDDGEEEEN